MAAFESQRKILFQHCDPAGIVFYPRYFELLNQIVEEWFETELGVSFQVLHEGRQRGIPTVDIETRFTAPSRLGETLIFRYGIERLKDTSLTARFEATGTDGTLKLAGSQTLVHVDLESAKPVPWPDDIRRELTRFAIDEEVLARA